MATLRIVLHADDLVKIIEGGRAEMTVGGFTTITVRLDELTTEQWRRVVLAVAAHAPESSL